MVVIRILITARLQLSAVISLLIKPPKSKHVFAMKLVCFHAFSVEPFLNSYLAVAIYLCNSYVEN